MTDSTINELDHDIKPEKRKYKRKNRPGQGRKTSAATLIKDTQYELLKTQAERTQLLINMARGKATAIECPACKHVFEKVIGDGADSKLLQYLDTRIQGKATTDITELFNRTISNSELVELYNICHRFESEFNEQMESELPALEAMIQDLPIKGKRSKTDNDTGINESNSSRTSQNSNFMKSNTVLDIDDTESEHVQPEQRKAKKFDDHNYVEVTST